MKNNFKMIFFLLMILSTLFLISSNSWINLWLWLEINLISFISLMIDQNKKISIESSIIYFLIQVIASMILLFSLTMILYNKMFIKFLIFTLMLKIGSSPIHFWLLLMIKGMKWNNIFILLTWQKISPLILLMYMYNFNMLIVFFLSSMVIGSISSFNFSCLKKIMSFSSINQLSWLMISLMFNKLFKIYFLFYFIIMFLITKSLKMFNLNFLNQIYMIYYKKIYILIFLNFLSLGGLPPFLGFFPKMIIMMKINNNFLIILMIIFSLIILFIYIRIIYSFLMLNSLKIFKLMKNKYFLMINLISIFNNFLMIFLLFLF